MSSRVCTHFVDHTGIRYMGGIHAIIHLPAQLIGPCKMQKVGTFFGGSVGLACFLLSLFSWVYFCASFPICGVSISGESPSRFRDEITVELPYMVYF